MAVRSKRGEISRMKVVNLRKEPYTHYIGRGSIFGNPYPIDENHTRERVIEMYEVYARQELMKAIAALPGDAILGCYCKPKACHGDVIIKIWHEGGISRMTDLQKVKEARRKFRSACGEATKSFNMYGLGDHIPAAILHVIEAAEQFHRDMVEAEKGEQ